MQRSSRTSPASRGLGTCVLAQAGPQAESEVPSAPLHTSRHENLGCWTR